MRNVYDVVERMIPLIPKNEDAFLFELRSLHQSALYAAPEAHHMWWSEFHRIINEYLPAPNDCTDWQLQVGDIFMDKA